MLQSICVGFSFVLSSFEFTIVSVSCFFVAAGSSEQTERNSTHSSHIIFAFGFGAEMQRDFFLLSYIADGF